MELHSEWRWYQQQKSQWLPGHRGQFVVIHGENIIGSWHTYTEALAEGYRQCGLGPFLVQQVFERDACLLFH